MAMAITRQEAAALVLVCGFQTANISRVFLVCSVKFADGAIKSLHPLKQNTKSLPFSSTQLLS
jgi:predicted RNA polymerase sigma factor